MKNREKFREVFGFTPFTDADCIAPAKVCESENRICEGCPFDGWWDKDYKACFKLREDMNE